MVNASVIYGSITAIVVMVLVITGVAIGRFVTSGGEEQDRDYYSGYKQFKTKKGSKLRSGKVKVGTER